MTTPLDWPITLEGVEELTTQALEERDARDALGIGVLTEGGETPRAIMAEVGVDMPSPELDIYELKGTPDSGELKGETWTITGSLKSIRGVL